MLSRPHLWLIRAVQANTVRKLYDTLTPNTVVRSLTRDLWQRQ